MNPSKDLLQILKNDLYIRLGISPVHGIGVFAIRPIPKGCRELFGPATEEWIPLPIEEVEQLPAHVRSLIETYCLFDEKNYFVPSSGFRLIDPVIYLNHSKNPNIISINDGDQFEALRDIEEGEELVVDYGLLSDGLDEYNVNDQ